MDLEKMVADLSELGFFKFVPAQYQAEARRDSVRALADGSLDYRAYQPGGLECVREWRGSRFFSADAEDLAERGVGGFLWECVPLFAHEGITVAFLADCESEGGGRCRYEVLVDSDRHQVYDFADGQEIALWGEAHRRTVEIVNAVLSLGGSSERAFGAAAHNDAAVYILTNELFDFVRQLPLADLYRPLEIKSMP